MIRYYQVYTVWLYNQMCNSAESYYKCIANHLYVNSIWQKLYIIYRNSHTRFTVCTCVCLKLLLSIHLAYKWFHIHLHIHTYIHTPTYTCTHIHTSHTYIHTYIYTYIHTPINTQVKEYTNKEKKTIYTLLLSYTLWGPPFYSYNQPHIRYP